MKHDPCCGTHQPRSTSLDPSQGAEAPDYAGAHAQTQGRDPVCGMTPSRNTPYRAGYDGREYLFCSSPCLQKLKAGPAEYVKNDKAVINQQPTIERYRARPPLPRVENEHVASDDVAHADRLMVPQIIRPLRASVLFQIGA